MRFGMLFEEMNQRARQNASSKSARGRIYRLNACSADSAPSRLALHHIPDARAIRGADIGSIIVLTIL